MELSILTRFRIAAVFAVGILLIGLLAWPLAQPEPFGVVSISAGSITVTGALVLAVLAFLAGFLSYYISWPYGREIALLAAPAGLALWSLRTGTIANLIQSNPALTYRKSLFANFCWEPIFWLAIVALGFAGVYLAQRFYKAEVIYPDEKLKDSSKQKGYPLIILSIAASTLIAEICIGIFAQNVTFYDGQISAVTTQPTNAQIAFGVFVAFGIAAFAVKKWLGYSYIWTISAGVLVIPFAVITSFKEGVLERLVDFWPGNFFPDPVVAVLPIQLVSFGTIGAIAGYWLAVRYEYWHRYERE